MEKTQRSEAEQEEQQEEQQHHPKHRRDDVPVDGDELGLDQFGEDPDTELVG